MSRSTTIIGKQCRDMLTAGVSRKEIAEKLGCTVENVSYHAGRMGLTKRRTSERWSLIQADLDAGMTPTAVSKKYGISRTSIYQAKGRGVVSFRRHQIDVTNLTEAAQKLVQSLAKHGVTLSVEVALDVVREWSE